ncbi:helix-turn-helix domain-containing protein [Desulfovibrio piger]|uniref:helix-turn-helix domain-containing protein n=1 Tax=Desulfovibrio piger TaxID=901 RepID=UPI0026F18CC4|nr:helix-turn-helix transcriptional regulator [Desulfovibrio piger]
MEFFERLREERKRLKLNQSQLAALAGTTKNSQLNYEKGNVCPSATYLAAIAAAGVDVQYVLTGRRSAEPVLTPEEKNLLDAWQNAPQAVRAAALAALQAGAKKEKPTRTIRMGNVKNDGKMAIVNGDINGNVNL